MKHLKTLLLLPILFIFGSCAEGGIPDDGGDSSFCASKMVATSPNSITIEWKESADAGKHYTISLFDRMGAEPIQEYIVSTAVAGPRFTIPYIRRGATYYVKVKDSKGRESSYAQMTTNVKPREFDNNAAVASNFDASPWGFDYINKAHGVKLDGKSVGSFDFNSINDAAKYSSATSSVADAGGRLQSCSDKLLELLGLSDYSSLNTYLYPGYVRIGTNNSSGTLTTPKLLELRGNNAKVTVSFKACAYSESLSAQPTKFYVDIVDAPNGEAIKSISCSVVGGAPKWSQLSVKFDNVTRSNYIRFRTEAGAPIFIDEIEVLDDFTMAESEIYGFVKDTSGSPIGGVSVSNGFKVVQTSDDGLYTLPYDKRSKYVYFSIPEDCKVPFNEYGQSCFFKKIESSQSRYDFTLERAAKEDEFSLFVIADTHGASYKYIDRLYRECAPGVREEAEYRNRPCYTVILGDIVCASTSTSEEEYYQTIYMGTMRDMFSVSNVTTPTFFVMGNHDHDRRYFDAPPYSDLVEFNYHVQDAYENVFGPSSYSFNRGDVHIISMRDILWPSSSIKNATSLDCYGGFSDEQVEWLRQDLSFVPKSKMVILCVHIPLHSLYGSTSSTYGKKNITKVLDMLKPYPNAQVFSGHSHRNSNIPVGHPSNYSGVNEMTFVGNWGHTSNRCMGDGTPFGFGVYDFSGASIEDNYFRPCTSRVYDKNYQMRAYLSDMLMGMDYSTQNSKQTYGWYGSYYALSDTKYIYVNIFNAHHKWNVKLYIDGKSAGSFSYMTPNSSGDWSNVDVAPFTWGGLGTGTKNDPRRPSSSGNTTDWWYMGAQANFWSSPGKQTLHASCYHMYRCEISKEDADALRNGTKKMEIKATDSYGNTYTSSKLFTVDDVQEYLRYDD